MMSEGVWERSFFCVCGPCYSLCLPRFGGSGSVLLQQASVFCTCVHMLVLVGPSTLIRDSSLSKELGA